MEQKNQSEKNEDLLAFHKKESTKKFWIPDMMGKNFFDGVLVNDDKGSAGAAIAATAQAASNGCDNNNKRYALE